MYDKAEEHLRRAVKRLSIDYTRPINTEALYHLGVSLRAQGKLDEAYEAFARATWDYAFHSPAQYQLAELSCRKGEFATALEQVDQSLATNALDNKARDLGHHPRRGQLRSGDPLAKLCRMTRSISSR
jgi:tetratricopeptide (TPR) repeat protein